MNPREYAERAALGSVLLDPDQLARLDFLEPDDFFTPQYGELFRAARDLYATGAAPQIDALDEAERGPALARWATDTLDAAKVRGVDLPQLHTLMAAAPTPAHAVHYGRLVLEAGIHRAIAREAIHLTQVVRSAGQQGPDMAQTFEIVDAYRSVFDHLARRWGVDPLAGPAAPTDGVDEGEQASPATLRGDQRDEDQADAGAELWLLPAIVAAPERLAVLADWLDARDFARPELGEVYAAAQAVHARGEPVDPVTVVFELHRREAWSDRLSPDEAISLLTAPAAGEATYLATEVLEGSIRRNAEQVAATMHALAHTPGLTPERLLPAAAAQLDRIRAEENRWHNAGLDRDQARYSPDPPQPPAPSAARQHQ